MNTNFGKKWEKLLSSNRLYDNSAAQNNRTDFQKDRDRLVFSFSFRRMKDKTQVFPLAKNDYIHNRLTHSLEVSCVGRSLGCGIGQKIIQKYPNLAKLFHSTDFGSIVEAACLAHDIGNPPFGHLGEQTLRDYFNSENAKKLIDNLDNQQQINDLQNIEGNAQGFRVINRLENIHKNGGLNLTFATIGASSKYPALAYKGNIYKKNGCYLDDWDDFSNIFNQLGLPYRHEFAFARHPLSYLMEAADDICYLIIDLEDAYQAKQISYQEAFEYLNLVAKQPILNNIDSKSAQLAILRSKAINLLIDQTIIAFMEYENDLISGNFANDLLSCTNFANDLEEIRQFSNKAIYANRVVLENQVAGNKSLTGLIDIHCQAILHKYLNSNFSTLDQLVLKLLPIRYQQSGSLYQQILAICDYVVGMTDSYAVNLYKKLAGISL